MRTVFANPVFLMGISVGASLTGTLFALYNAFHDGALLGAKKVTPPVEQLPSSSLSSSPHDDDEQTEAVRARVICFGDSLTQRGFEVENHGWTAQLAEWLTRRLDVINRGFGGYTSRWGLIMLKSLLAATPGRPVKLVLLFWGANDAVLPGKLQHTPVEEYKSNLVEMVNYIRKVHPAAGILILTPPPIHYDSWEAHRESKGSEMDRGLENTARIVEAAREVAKEVEVPLVDVYNLLGSGDQRMAKIHLVDGVHLSASGNDALFAGIQAAISKHLPHLSPEHYPMQAPLWGDVDIKDLSRSILRKL